MIQVQAAKHLDGYRILVTFSDGLKKVVDLTESLVGPVFEPLRDPGYFSQFSLDPESETLVWPNGADVSPEYLYQNGTLYQSQSA